MKKTPLAAATKRAMTRPPPPPPQDPLAVLKLDGEHARATIESLIDAMADIGRANDTRGYTCLILLRGACDVARAQAHLIATDPRDMAGAAGALHRSQLDHFLRGAYLGMVASEEQLEDFLTHDEGVRTLPPTGKPQRIGPIAMATDLDKALLGANIGFKEPLGLGDAVEKSWDTLCGLVHGGARIQELYQSGGAIGCNASPEAVMATLHNAVHLTCLAIPVMWRFSGQDNGAKTAAADRAIVAMRDYQAAHDKRLARLGYPVSGL